MSDYYEILEIEKNATQDEIKKAYKKTAIKFHPDKGGDEKKFKEINEAYQVLSDENKRRMYDLYGKEGIEQQEEGNPFSFFEQMFQQRGPQVEPLKVPVSLSLDESFNGSTKTCHFTRMKPKQKIPKGFQGDMKKFLQEEECEKEIIIPNGAKPGEHQIFHEEGHQILLPDGKIIKGDLVFIYIDAKEYNENIENINFKTYDFERDKDNHLVLQMKINLIEKYCGLEREIDYFNNQKLKLKFYEPIDTNKTYRIPCYGINEEDIFVHFILETPDIIPEEHIEDFKNIIEKIIEKRTNKTNNTGETLEVEIMEKENSFSRMKEEEMEGSVQCAHQ